MWKLFLIPTIALGLTLASSVDVNAENNGEITIAVRATDVDGDEGRFREDNYRGDEVKGGIESLHMESVEGDDKIQVDLRAFFDDEYDLRVKFSREDVGYLLLDASFDRRYYDGSNEFWDPAGYGLTGNEVVPDNRTSPPGVIDDHFYTTADFVDRPDEDLYTDRTDVTIEAGLTKPDAPQLIVGYKRWQREGDELLLRGERARVTNPGDSKNGMLFPRTRSVAAVSHLDGVSDLFYVDLSNTFNDTHTLRFRHEYETYTDEQLIEFPRYLWDQSTPSAVIEQYRTFEDEPEFKHSVSLATYDSHLDEDTYVSAGFMYSDLTNETSREVIRPNRGKPTQVYHSTGTVTENTREAKVGTFGFRKDKIFGLENLSLVAGLRAEQADTEAGTSLLAGGVTPRHSMSNMDEIRVEENVEVTFRGIPSTVASLELDLEQRDIDWDEFEDVGSHEIFEASHFDSGIQFFDYEAEIEHQNYEYTVKVVNRATPVKLTAKYQMMSKDREYDIKKDADPRFFPGRIGGYSIDGDEIELGLQKILMSSSCSLTYQHKREEIETDLALGETQDWTINRVTASLAGAPTERLYLLCMVAYEEYDLETPTNITDPKSHWAQGTAAYDYEADYLTVLLNAECSFSDNVTGDLQYQLTDTVGDNEYEFNKVIGGLSFLTENNNTIKLEYEFYDFQDITGFGSDDYTAHAVMASYTRVI